MRNETTLISLPRRGQVMGIDFEDLADHPGPAIGGDAADLPLGNPQMKIGQACLADLVIL
jgi:hypothetical protein